MEIGTRLKLLQDIYPYEGSKEYGANCIAYQGDTLVLVLHRKINCVYNYVVHPEENVHHIFGVRPSEVEELK